MRKTGIHMALAGAAALALLAGCTSTVSRGVNEQGQAQEVVFPALDKANAIAEGIFPNVENLRKIGAGVRKDDLYYLVGVPHFSEIHGAREWDYIFKFRDQVGGPVTVCQYKVIFDRDMKAQSFHWKPEACAARLGGAAKAVPVQRISLKADALFAFGKYQLADMRAEGRHELDKLAQDLNAAAPEGKLRIVGHTDRLGDAAANQRLSQQRAQTVLDYLADKGVAASRMTAVGMGERQPVVQCNQTARQALIDCLAPNRRVDVEVH